MVLTDDQFHAIELVAFRKLRTFLAEGGPQNAVTGPITVRMSPDDDPLTTHGLIDVLAGLAAVFLVDRHRALQTDDEQALPDDERDALARQRAEDWLNTQILESSFAAGHNEDPRTAG